MGSSGDALTSERLVEIREQVDEYARKVYKQADVEFGYGLHELLAEVERQRAALAATEAREAALVKRLDKAMAIVQMVANRWPLFSTDRVDELVKQARALLASTDEGSGGDASEK